MLGDDTDYLFSYFDEVFIIILLIYIIFKNNGKLRFRDTYDKKGMLFATLFFLCGMMSSLIGAYQSVSVAIVDSYICLKFYITYFCFKNLKKDAASNYLLLNKLCVVSKISIIVIFSIMVLDVAISIFPKPDVRYGIESVQLFFGHPTFYAAACVTCVACLISGSSNKKSIIELLIVLGLVCCMMSLRIKAIGASLAILLTYLYFIKMRGRNILFSCVVGGIIVLVVGYDQLSFYYGENYLTDDNFVRARLLWDSISIASLYFPLGSGFGTFGSDMSVKFFSPLYLQYGYFDTKFLTDMFWPTVLAQTGVLGLLCFLAILYNLIKNVFKIINYDVHAFCSSLSVLIYLLISSTGESAFFHPYSVAMFVIVGLDVGLCRQSYDGTQREGIGKHFLQ